MAHGLNTVIKRGIASANCKNEGKGIGSRRIFAPHFKLQVLDSYRNDADCKGNQRATARKYGIHRRQIQKWLQVENTLRSSVSAKEKSCNNDGAGERVPEVRKCEFEAVALSSGRQRDDEQQPRSASAAEPRVPALAHSPSAAPWPESGAAAAAPLPLDYTTHGRGLPPPSPLDPSAPIDLSFKRPTSPGGAPVRCWAPPTTTAQRAAAASPSLAAHSPHPDVWDLSTKSAKRRCRSPLTSPKPVKLFKPYLDDVAADSDGSSPASVVKLEPAMPCCAQSCEAAFYYNNNNNNVVCDIKSDYGGSNTYTLLELQPKPAAAAGYYYPSYPGYGDYETGVNYYEDFGGQGMAPLKQRQSYSLDFKLSAIDCYYGDSVCKGNQRAVATKYNVHRRQVQKWLKQAEELRLRNETMKQMHAVR